MLNKKKKNEIIAFLWLVVAFLLFLCLVSYHPEDIGYEVSSPNAEPQNLVGIAGAYLSWLLIMAIGKGSFFCVFLICFWALAQWSERKMQSLWLRVFSGSLFFVSSCATLSLWFSHTPADQFSAGGFVGYFAGFWLTELFGASAIIVSTALFLLSVLMATEFMLFPLFVALFKNSRNALNHKAFKGLGKNIQSILSKRSPFQGSLIKSQKIKIRSLDGEETTSKNILKKPKSLFRNRLAEPEPDVMGAKKPMPKPRIKIAPEEPSRPKKKMPKMDVGNYKLPSLDFLEAPQGGAKGGQANRMIEEQSRILQDTLADFSIDAKVVEVEQGPVITRFELQPASGVKLQKITGLQDNISLALQATSVRILAPIPGKARIGIEVPNPEKQTVVLKSILASNAYQQNTSKLPVVIGKDAAGHPLVGDLDKMPHLLIAGSTGSGKTVCMNSLIMSLIYRLRPDELKFIMVDPKRVELVGYNGIPHLLTPVIDQVEKVTSVLTWLISEMTRRYDQLSKLGARNIAVYNIKADAQPEPKDGKEPLEKMPYIVLVIDELADIMMTQGKEVESAITRLAQLSRAVGIHLILATQRPSVDVITGVIKANFPSRIAFQVASKVDSRTVLDANGAECLLGRGDLLFQDPAKPHMIRGQGTLVTDEEIERTVEAIKDQQKPIYDEEILQAVPKKQEGSQDFRGDEHYPEACKIIVSSGQASVSMLQRRLGLGYTRAARLVDMMEEDGIVGPHRGSKPREVLMSLEELDERNKGPQHEQQDDDNAGE